MKIVIPGGTGQVGRVLAKSLRTHQHDVVVLSRGQTGASHIAWDGRSGEADGPAPRLERSAVDTLTCVELQGYLRTELRVMQQIEGPGVSDSLSDAWRLSIEP